MYRWVFESVEVWVCGCVGVWLCGWVGGTNMKKSEDMRLTRWRWETPGRGQGRTRERMRPKGRQWRTRNWCIWSLFDWRINQRSISFDTHNHYFLFLGLSYNKHSNNVISVRTHETRQRRLCEQIQTPLTQMIRVLASMGQRDWFIGRLHFRHSHTHTHSHPQGMRSPSLSGTCWDSAKHHQGRSGAPTLGQTREKENTSLVEVDRDCVIQEKHINDSLVVRYFRACPVCRHVCFRQNPCFDPPPRYTFAVMSNNLACWKNRGARSVSRVRRSVQVGAAGYTQLNFFEETINWHAH